MTLMLSADQIIGDSIAFALGLATTLALLGIAASFAGKAYGQIGKGLPLAASGLAVIMGLNLLEVFIQLFDWLSISLTAFCFKTFIPITLNYVCLKKSYCVNFYILFKHRYYLDIL